MTEATHISDFFELYPDFDHDPFAPVSSEFRRLVDYHGWERGSTEDQEAWSQFGVAMGKQFSDYYGSDVRDINAWQALCAALEVDPVPDTITQCKQIIKSTHVNLVDFIDIQVTGEPVQIFRTEQELRTYTRGTKKYYPLEAAKESGVLAFLLRNIRRP